MLSELPELIRGDVFAERYELIRCIGMGGMGSVWEAKHTFTKTRVALKVLRTELVADEGIRQRFAQEAQVTADIADEHLVRILDAGIEPTSGLPYIAMDLLEGQNLKSLLKERRRLAADEAIGLLNQVANLLDQTHERGIVHRDLKPDNLFLHQSADGSSCLKVLDFGIAKVVAETLSAETTAALGTPLFMAPEQIQGVGNIGPAADLYSLAHVAYTLLVGEPYYLPELREQSLVEFCMFTAVLGAPEPASERADRKGVQLPQSFDDWFAKAAALEPNERFARATEMMAALEAVFDRASGAPIVGQPPIARPAEQTADTSDHQTAPTVPIEKRGEDGAAPCDAPQIATSIEPAAAPPVKGPSRFRWVWLGALFAVGIGVGAVCAWLNSRAGRSETTEVAPQYQPSSSSAVGLNVVDPLPSAGSAGGLCRRVPGVCFPIVIPDPRRVKPVELAPTVSSTVKKVWRDAEFVGLRVHKDGPTYPCDLHDSPKPDFVFVLFANSMRLIAKPQPFRQLAVILSPHSRSHLRPVRLPSCSIQVVWQAVTACGLPPNDEVQLNYGSFSTVHQGKAGWVVERLSRRGRFYWVDDATCKSTCKIMPIP